MAQLQGVFNPNEHEPFSDFVLLPKGQWNVAIKKDEWKECNGGHMLQITFVVLDGTMAGTEVTDNFTLAVSEQKNVDMAQRKLGMLCRALNYMQALTDTSILHGHPLTVRTDIRFNDKDGKVRGFADIKKYEHYVGANMAQGADAVQPTPPAPAAAAPGLGLGTAPAAGGLRLPPSAPMGAQAPAPVAQLPAAPAAPGMPAGFALPGQNTLQPMLGAPGMGMAPAPVPTAAPAPGAQMFRLPGQ